MALIQIGTLTPSGSGLLQGGPQGAASFPNARILYQPGDQYGTAVAMPLNPANGQFDLVEQFATADLYGDFLGYFRAPTGGFITGSCPAGNAVRSVNPDGSVVCESTVGANAIHQRAMRPWVMDLASVGPNYCCYIGGFTDGTDGYLVPYGLNGAAGPSGRLVRFNIDKFATSQLASVDIAAVDSSAVGFYGGFTDGRYGYLVPYVNSGGKHGRIARVDMQNFANAGVTILNLQNVDAALTGFTGGFTDGRYGYVFGTGYPTLNGKVARVDLANFTAGGVTVLDLGQISSALKGFGGGFQDGHYGYLVPHNNGAPNGKLVRIDLANFSTSGVTVLDLATVDAALVGFIGGFADGRYAWLAPYTGTKAARIDLAKFTSDGVRAIDFAAIDPSLTGFIGAFSNGKYGVMVPSYKLAASGFYQKVVRIQLQQGAGTP